MRFQHHASFSAWLLRLLPLATALLLHAKNGMAEVELSDHWKIIDSYYYFTTSKLELSFLVHEQIESRMVDIKLYDSHDCLAGANEDPPTASDITVNDFMSYDRTTSVNATSQERSIDFTLTIDHSNIQNAPKLQKHTPVDNEAQLSLCVRASVYSSRLSDPSAVLRTWREDLVNLTLDTENNYEIKNATVYSWDVDTGMNVDRNIFEIDAYLCNFRFTPIQEKPTELASSVRICVQPHMREQDEGEQSAHEINFSIRSIDSFLFSRTDVTQHAVVDGKASSNGLSILECEIGSDVCSFATELVAAFFDSNGMISGEGMMSIQYGSAVVDEIPFRVEIPIYDPEKATSDKGLDDVPWYEFLDLSVIITTLFLIVVILCLILHVVEALRGLGHDKEEAEERAALAARHANQVISQENKTKTIRKSLV